MMVVTIATAYKNDSRISPVEQERVEPDDQSGRTQFKDDPFRGLDGHNRVQPVGHPGSSLRLNNDRVGDLVVEAAAVFTEDEQHLDDRVHRNDAEQPVHDVALPDQIAERRR